MRSRTLDGFELQAAGLRCGAVSWGLVETFGQWPQGSARQGMGAKGRVGEVPHSGSHPPGEGDLRQAEWRKQRSDSSKERRDQLGSRSVDFLPRTHS